MVLCWACWFTSYSNAQELVPGTTYTTNNIVIPTTTATGSTWTGAVYQDQLTCWRGGDPGYCGPQAIVRPGDYLNFSYGSTYVYQQQHINTILPAATGLQVNGYNFGFTAKNGNGWDNGMTDQLTALVRFWDSTGNKGANNLLYGNAWNLSSKYNWTTFNYSETFQSPLTATNVGLVQYGFIGKDNNGWAGPYGPEVMNVNFSVKYSVDPCASNPMYAPTCPGYLDALTKLLPKQTSATVVAEAPPPPPPAQEAAPPPPGTQQTTPGSQLPPPPGSQLPPPPGTQPAPGAQSAPGTQLAPVTQQASTQEKSSGGPVNLSFALNLIAKNADKEKALEQQTVANAIAEAQSSSTKAQNETSQTVASLNAMSAQSVETGQAMAAQAQSTGSSSTSRSSSGPQLQQSQTAGTGLQTTNIQGFQQTAQMQQAVSQIQTLQAQQAFQFQETAVVSYIAPQSQTQPTAFTVTETTQTSQPTAFVVSANPRATEPETPQSLTGFITDRTNPLREILETAPIVLSDFTEQRQDNRNRVVQPNELAVGVDLTKIATIPQGYASYTNLVLRDAQFYEIREVYKNQTVVDNVRVLRGLGSDQKHQDLVNLQYK